MRLFKYRFMYRRKKGSKDIAIQTIADETAPHTALSVKYRVKRKISAE